MNLKPRSSVLITGVTGFVGGAVANGMRRDERFSLKGAVRRTSPRLSRDLAQVVVSGLDAETDWEEALNDVNVILHAAARVHVMDERASDPLSAFRRVNVEGTMNLARQAAAAGVRRFVFVSSIKVNGERTARGRPFKADDAPAPEDPYGISKGEAEDGLRSLSAQTGMEVVVVRPPLVYGPGVKANFGAMVRWLARGLPLPLGAIRGNRRSLVGLDNLVDLLITCMDHPAAANQTFLISDGEDLSTTELLRRTAKAMGRPPRLLPVPPAILEWGAGLLSMDAVAQRLFGSLQVDISKTREQLAWTPRVGVDEGLRRAVADFVK